MTQLLQLREIQIHYKMQYAMRSSAWMLWIYITLQTGFPGNQPIPVTYLHFSASQTKFPFSWFTNQRYRSFAPLSRAVSWQLIWMRNIHKCSKILILFAFYRFTASALQQVSTPMTHFHLQ